MKYYFATFQKSITMVSPQMHNISGSKEMLSKVLNEHPFEYLKKQQAQLPERSEKRLDIIFFKEITEEEYGKF